MIGGTMALPPTPARTRMVELVSAAIARGQQRGLRATSVYLSAIDARACGLSFGVGDPPRVLGLPVRLTKGKYRVYAKFGLSLSIPAIVPNAASMTHWWRLRATLPDRHGQPCKITAVGAMNSIGIQFWDGERHVVSRYAVRRFTA